MTRTRECRIGIDVGGTFTDFVLADPATGCEVNFKDPSTPADPSAAVETWPRALLTATGVKAAIADYGVVIDGRKIDPGATAERRSDMASSSSFGPFDYGPARRAWEETFGHGALNAVAARLLDLPTPLRDAERGWLFADRLRSFHERTGKP